MTAIGAINSTTDVPTSGNIGVSDLANGTAGEMIAWDAAGAPATVAVGTATHVLTSNGVGVAPTFQAAGGGGNKTVFLMATAGQNDGSVSWAGNSPAVILADGVTDTIRLGWSVPDGGATISSVKLHGSTNATSGNTFIQSFGQATASGISINTGSTSDSLSDQYATNATAQGLEIIDISLAFDGLTLTAGYNMGIKILRIGGNAADTIGASYLVYGVEIVYS